MTEPNEHDETEPAEPVPDERDADVVEPDADDGGEPAREPELEPERPAASGPQSEKELERALKSIDKAGTAYRNKVSSVMGEAAQDLLPCPLCNLPVAGMVFPQVPDEAREATEQFLRGGEVRRYQPAEGVVTCPVCLGLGKLEYPTEVEHVKYQNCLKCGAAGYIVAPAPTPEPVAAWTPAVVPANSSAPAALACPQCGAQGMAGKPHFCQPAPVGAV